ncbi:MAG: hypothetical protein FJ102_16230 [Deltaproteobacteria bacterium]|nr:hypothetical protein [Deltaproteobacteria bacterium]
MFFALLGCAEIDKLFNPETYGAYTCDEYCEQVVSKTDECAEEECANNPECGEYSEEDLSAYAAEGRDDWEGASKQDMVDSCNDDLGSADKSDSECQAETAVLNNLTCDEILSLLGEIRSAGE